MKHLFVMAIHDTRAGLTPIQMVIKRTFDIVGAAFGLMLTGWIILFAFAAASWNTRSNGFFVQKRVGRYGKIFRVIKIRTMRPVHGVNTTVTTNLDPRITKLGQFFRYSKIDELPQLVNVLIGDMSFVGPRPDVPGFADRLEGSDKVILSVRPGITGPATLKYRDEEVRLANVDDPERYNREVIFPDKVKINREYVVNWSFSRDLYYIWCTVVGSQ